MNKPIVLADFHNAGLFFSLKLLLEDRFKGTLLRPIGMEWFSNGFFSIAEPYQNNSDTIKQYLQIKPEFKPIDNTPILNKNISFNNSFYEVDETSHGYIQKCITWQQFLDTDIDLIIASIPRHWVTFTKLRDLYKPKAKVICQSGNIFWENEEALKDGTVKNLLASVKPFKIDSSINAVWYHEEMKIIDFKESSTHRKIYSFVNCLPNPELFFKYKNALTDYDMKSYGASCPDGWVNGIDEQYKKMQEADW